MKRDHGRTAAHGDDVVVTVPLTLKRRGGRKEINSAANPRVAASTGAQAPLALVIARAHRWRALLESGRYGTVRELSGALGMDSSYVARLLRLTLLAPDITEAILEGTEPSGISLEKLFRLPLDWGRQRDALGLPTPKLGCPGCPNSSAGPVSDPRGDRALPSCLESDWSPVAWAVC